MVALLKPSGILPRGHRGTKGDAEHNGAMLMRYELRNAQIESFSGRKLTPCTVGLEEYRVPAIRPLRESVKSILWPANVPIEELGP